MAESMVGLKRTHRCTEVSSADIGSTVTVMGWVAKRRNLGSLIFVDLRDRSGLLQILFDENIIGKEGFDKAYTLRNEFVIAVVGKVIKRREQFIKDINKIIKPIHRKLTENSEEIEVVYKKSCNEDELYNKIIENRKKDIKLKSTSAGPHRDDILFFNKDINIRTYGSQGQKRTVALSLKLAEIELVKSLINDTPVLLLDDVLSELDSKLKKELFKKQ